MLSSSNVFVGCILFFLTFLSLPLNAGAVQKNSAVIEGLVTDSASSSQIDLVAFKVGLHEGVRVFEKSCKLSLRSGERFRCAGLEEGSYVLVAQSKRTSSVTFYPHGTSVDSAEAIRIHKDEIIDLSLFLAANDYEKLVVSLPLGSEPRSLEIIPTSEAGGELPLRFPVRWSAMESKYTTILPPGSYVIKASWGCGEKISSEERSLSILNNGDMELTLANDSQDVVGEISAGAQLPSSVTLIPRDPHLETVTLVVDQGRIRYSGLASGVYRLVAQGYSLSILRSSTARMYYDDEVVVDRGADLFLHVGASIFSKRLSVHLKTEDRHFSDLWVSVARDPGRLATTVQSADSGNFVAALPGPGEYQVSVCRSAYGPVYPDLLRSTPILETMAIVSVSDQSPNSQNVDMEIGDPAQLPLCPNHL